MTNRCPVPVFTRFVTKKYLILFTTNSSKLMQMNPVTKGDSSTDNNPSSANNSVFGNLLDEVSGLKLFFILTWLSLECFLLN